MLNCHDATRLMSEAQDRKLGAKERLTLKLHVMICTGCRNFSRHLPVLRRITRDYVSGANERQASSGRDNDMSNNMSNNKDNDK